MDVHISPLSRFINKHYGFWKLTFGHQVKVTYKVRKSVYNIEMHFKQFFTYLERTSTFITSIIRTIYWTNSPEVFFIFLVMFCTENKQTRGGSHTPRSSMVELFVTMEVIPYWQSSSNLDDGGIAELPLYAIIFSFHDKIESMVVEIDPENSIISHTGTFFLFSMRGI